MSANYVYVFVRKDLTPQQQIVQVAHACLNGAGYGSDARKMAKANIVLIGVDDELELVNTRRLLAQEAPSIRTFAFFEQDHDLGYTAFCTSPVTGSMREVFSGWKILQGNPPADYQAQA